MRRVRRRTPTGIPSELPRGSEAPDYCGPVIAWRVWYVADKEGEASLSSVYHGTVWPKREALVADCCRLRPRFFKKHPSPLERCRCGIYAARPDALHGVLENASRLPATPAVIGRVSLWGLVIEGDRGWRASRAYPERLFLARKDGTEASTPRIANDLRGYGVPVDVLDASTAHDAINEIVALVSKSASEADRGIAPTVDAERKFWIW